MSKIGDLIMQISKQGDQDIDTKICTVTEVDEDERTIDVKLLNGDDIFLGVRLQSKISSSTGFVMFPTIGSNVIIELINHDDAYVSVMTEVDKLIIGVGSMAIQIYGDQIIFNSGANEGLVNVNDLVAQLNTIESDLNSLKAVFAAWLEVPGDGGGALKLAAATWFAQPIILTIKPDIEDDTITH